ncbi:MAG: M24 family metallopeptidase [Deltaproteobacteria bacterium]|nr:M24 family metallopeptidase [Deltaproteobacteria bacterium]
MNALTTSLAARRKDPSRFPTDADLIGYDRAQSFAKMIAGEIAARVQPGMNERDAVATTAQVFKDHGIKDHWHMPVIGVADGSTKFTSAGRLIKSVFGARKRVLRDGDLIFIDIAPFFEGYPSDFTLTHLYGKNERLQRLIDCALGLTRRISTHLREDQHAGQTWEWIKREIESSCAYDLRQFPISPVAHRFAKVPESWPYFREIGTVHLFVMGAPILLRSSKINMRGLWVIEPLLVDRELDRAAKTEEIVFVTGGETLIFGEKPFAG